jgi:hypothetical protein
MAKKKTKSEHYVDNKEFLKAMSEFRLKVIEAEEKGEKRPRTTDYIGSCFMKIAAHLSYSPNFKNYTFREEMVESGIENCLQYMDNFDPAKSTNPFSYFTQIIWYAFLRKIEKEKKVLYAKFKSIEKVNLANDLDKSGGFQYHDNIKVSEWSQEYMGKFITDFEENRRTKKKKALAKKGLEVIE